MTDHRDSSVAPTTVLDRVRPTVVRRRVYDVSELHPESATRPAPTPSPEPPAPSAPVSEALAPAPPADTAPAPLAVVLGDETTAMNGVNGVPERPPPSAASGPPRREEPPAAPESRRRRTLVVGRSIQVAELARRMSVALEELVEALVRRGFFSTTAKTALRRESVRNVAEAFGWRVEGPPADVLLENMSCPAR